MKTFCISFSIIILTLNLSVGKIKNGYSIGITGAVESLRNLNALLLDEKGITSAQKKIIESRIKEVMNYIVYYELTETLLTRFRSIAPDLFSEIDTLRDSQGRTTDVYIKFIAEEQARVQAWGTTNIAQLKNDQDAYLSEFGERTVSVKVWVVNKSLLVLAHELGHVKYQVMDLARYFEYYKLTYPPGTTDPNYIGHDHNDLSGNKAIMFEKIFRENYVRYLKNGNAPGESPIVLRETIRKQVQSASGIALTNF